MKLTTKQQSQKESPSEQLTEVETIQNTPFTMVKTPNGYFLALGKYKLSEELPVKEEVKQLITPHNWDLLFKVIQIFQMNQEKN